MSDLAVSQKCRVWNVFNILLVVVTTGIIPHSLHASEQFENRQEGYPASLQPLANVLRGQYSEGLVSTQLLVQLAEVYLDMGDDLYIQDSERLRAYQDGAEFALQALTLDQHNASAHFLYAANLGHVAQLRGIIAAVLSINEIMSHVKAAVFLDSSHAPALHMLGMMYDGLPWIMGGDSQKALHYLKLAVAADKNYTHARLNLAKLYLKGKDDDLAKLELKALLATRSPRGTYAWSRHHVPEAQELLKALPYKGVSVSASFQKK